MSEPQAQMDRVDGEVVDLRQDPLAFGIEARPRQVTVEFAGKAGTLLTREGPVVYQVGDALLSGEDAERWPVRRDRFEAAYEAVTSVQGQTGLRYMKRPRVYWGKELATTTRVELSGQRGALEGRSGDWLVQYAPGELGIVAAELFDSLYKRQETAPSRATATTLRASDQSGGVGLGLLLPLIFVTLVALGGMFFYTKPGPESWACQPTSDNADLDAGRAASTVFPDQAPTYLCLPSPEQSEVSVSGFTQALDATLFTVQAFLGNVAPSSSHSSWLKVALLAAPLLLSAAAILAFKDELLEWACKVWQMWRPAPNLMLGGGWVASGLLQRLRRRTYVADLNGSCQAVKALDPDRTDVDFGQYDALDIQDLAKLGVRGSACIWIATGDDRRNIEVARHVLTLLAGQSNHPKLLVHVSDPRLMRVGWDLLKRIKDKVGCDVDLFDVNRLAARAVFRNRPPRLRSRVQPSLHLLILGCSDLTLALVVQAARHFVFSESPHECVRVTVAGTHANRLQEQCAALYPVLVSMSGQGQAQAELFPLIRLSFHECEETSMAPDVWTAWQTTDGDEGAGQPFDAVYVACRDDIQSVGTGLQAAALREVSRRGGSPLLPITVCLQDPNPGCVLIDALNGLEEVHAVQLFEACLTPAESYPGASMDWRAMLVNRCYQLASPGDLSLSRKELLLQAKQNWDRWQGHAYRWSDRMAADHIDVKIDWLVAERGLDPTQDWPADWREDLRGSADVRELFLKRVQAAVQAEGVLASLARIEHRRFVVERLVDGWLCLPHEVKGQGPSGLDAQEQKLRLRVNHTLVEFDRLVEVDREVRQQAVDERMIRAIPDILRADGELDNRLTA